MKKLSAAMLMALAAMSFSSCHKIVGNGPVVTEMRNTREFTEVEFAVPGNLRFIPSANYEIAIEAQRNIIDVIETYVRGDELKVKIRNNTNIKSHENITVTVKAPSVNAITLSGSGNLTIPTIFKPAHARLTISGSGNMQVNGVESDKLDVAVIGSGNIEILNGSVGHEEISISGSGDVNLFGVEANSAITRTSGSGNIRLFVNEELNVKISGSGDVAYKGSPSVNAEVSGSGKVSTL